MPDLVLSGRVTPMFRPLIAGLNQLDLAPAVRSHFLDAVDRLVGPGGRAGLLLPLDLFIRVSLIGSSRAEVSLRRVVRTDDDGRFSVVLLVDPLDGLGPVALLRADVIPYLPGDRTEPFQVASFLTGDEPGAPTGSPDERIFGVAQSLLTGVRVPVDTRGLRRTAMAIGSLPGEPPSQPFRDMPDVTVELRSTDGRELFGIAPAPGDDDRRTVDLVHVSDIPSSFYLRIRQGMVQDSFVDRPGRAVLARTRPQPPRTGPLTPRSLVLVRAEETAGIGTIAAGVPEEMAVPGLPVVVRNVDLDLVQHGEEPNRVLRIRAEIGIGWAEDDGGVFLLIGIGRFEGHYRLEALRPRLGPFDESEIDRLIDIAPLTVRYDILPGTDLDELVPGGFLGLENGLAASVNDQILPRIRQNFGRRIRDAIDARRRAVIDNRNPGFDTWPEIVDDIFATFFVQAEPLRITADGVAASFHVGFWAALLDLFTGDVDCPFNTLALMAPQVRVQPVAHSVRRFMDREGLEKAKALYQEHRDEIRKLFLRDPKTAREFARLLAQTHRILQGSRPGLTAREIAQAEAIATRWLPQVSDRLRAELAPYVDALGTLQDVEPSEAVQRIVKLSEQDEHQVRQVTG